MKSQGQGRGGQPTPVFTFSDDPSRVESRLGHEVDVPDRVLLRIAEACPTVDTGAGARVEAGRDWWPLTVSWGLAGSVPALPAVVATPASTSEVAALLKVCREEKIPVTPVAGRSGVCGASVPVFGGVALDMTGLSGIVDVDDESLIVTVKAGTFGDRFEEDLRDEHGLTIGHRPQSIALSTVGGWLACRGAGQYSTRYGKIEDLVVGMEVVLADGSVIRTGPGAPRAAAGPDLNQLFVGSEGTLGVITETRLRARPVPTATRKAAFGFDTFADGLDACRRILRRGAAPAVLRLYDAEESKQKFEIDRTVLVVLDEGDPALIEGVMKVVKDECTHGAELLDAGLVNHWLEHCNEVPSLEDLSRARIVADTIEVAASWASLPGLYKSAVESVMAINGTLLVSAHQSHSYTDGACLYFTFAGRPAGDGAAGANANAGDSYYRRAWDAVMTATLERGGAISHHHGIGINRGRHLRRSLGPSFDVLASIKSALDPEGILNPGKLGLPSRWGDAPWP